MERKTTTIGIWKYEGFIRRFRFREVDGTCRSGLEEETGRHLLET